MFGRKKKKPAPKWEQVKIKKEHSRNEFRKSKVSGHPAYIYAKIGNDYKFIGLTHSPITQNVKNIKLEKNPNPKDTRVAYFKPIPERQKKSKFKKPEFGWSFSEKDKKKIDKYKK